MKYNVNHEDVEYILAHLRQPELMTGEEFRHWLLQDGHLELFEELRTNRESYLYREYNDQIDLEKESRRFWLNRKSVGNRWKYYQIAAVCILLIGFSLFWMNREKSVAVEMVQEVPVGKKSAELILADGEHVSLTNQVLELQATVGVQVKNDSLHQLSYVGNMLANADQLIYHTLKTPVGADYYVQLADGTKVWLNCETTLKFPVNFGKNERKVFLEGQAYFQVEKAAEWPFIVVTEKMNVEVTGTSFDVNAYMSENMVRTTLVEGVVKVNDRLLRPSQQFMLNKTSGEIQVKIVDTQLYTGWIDGMFVFKTKRLEEVMDELAKWYGIQVFYQHEAVKDIRFSGNLERYKTVDEVLNVIRMLDKVVVTRQGNTVTFSGK